MIYPIFLPQEKSSYLQKKCQIVQHLIKYVGDGDLESHKQ